jgi:multidrug efflux system outer membrane protein
MYGPMSIIRSSLPAALLAAFILPATGCGKVGPEYIRPTPVFEIPGSFQHAAREGPSPTGERWWLLFGDDELAGLVDLALENNLDLREATSRILEAEAEWIRARSFRYPALGLQAGVSRQELPETVTGFGDGSLNTESYDLSLAAAYEVDLWGRLARADEAARAELLESEENRATIAQTLVSQVVRGYLLTRVLEKRLVIARSSIMTFEKSLEVIEGRYRRGLGTSLDVRRSRRTLKSAEALIPELKEELGRAQIELTALLGQYPRTAPAREPSLVAHSDLPSIPPGLPSDLLQRRPDIRAAESRLRALNARIGQAAAERYPAIILTGTLGSASVELQDLLIPESLLWRLALGLTQPLFDAGEREAAQQAAEARYQQAVSAYFKTILEAFGEVERSLLVQKRQKERVDFLREAFEEAKASQSEAQVRYLRGLEDYLTVLESQRTRYQLEDELVLTELALLTSLVTLYRALGGRWPDEFGETGDKGT